MNGPFPVPSLVAAVAWLALAAHLAGSISAVAHVRRLLASGMVSSEDTDIPGAGLLERARGVLLGLGIASLVCCLLATIEILTVVSTISDPGGIWITTLALNSAGASGCRGSSSFLLPRRHRSL